jgi:hypothetical protein
VHGIRRLKQNQDLPTEAVVPFLAYSRSVLQVSEEFNKRSRFRGKSTTRDANDNVKLYKLLYGFFEYRFLYVANNITDVENFELSFMCSAGLRGVKSFTANLGTEDEWTYHLDWEPLEELEHGTLDDGNARISISGSCRVRGFYLVHPEELASVILSIPTTINETDGAELSSFTVS